MRKEKIIHGIFITLVLTLSLVWLMPLLFSVTNSFKTYNDVISNFFSMPKHIDFAIYAETWQVLEFNIVGRNTIIYAVSTTLVCAIIIPMAAYKLGRTNTKISKVISLLFVMPIMIPFMTYCVPLCSLMGKLGLANTRPGYVLVCIGLNISFGTYVIRSFVNTVPVEIEECALIDGASPWRLFFSIVYPLLLPSISTVCIVVTVGTWNDLIVCKILASSSESLLNIQTKLYSRFSKTSSDWTHAFPAIVLAAIPTITFFLIMQEKVISGVTVGAVKG